MEKQLYDNHCKYTPEEITKILGDSLSTIFESDAEVLTISRKIYVKGLRHIPALPHPHIIVVDTDLNAEIHFDTGGTADYYEVLDVKVINTKNQVTQNHLRIYLTDRKYNPKNQRPDLQKAGYFLEL